MITMFWYIIILLITIILFIFQKKEGMTNNYLDGIDIIYWINLDRSKDRKQNMEKMFSDEAFSGIPNKRISAIDGTDDKNVYNLLETCNVTNKECACLLSHMEAIREFNKSNYEIALILEDDSTLEFKKYWKKSVKEIINNAPNDWEIIMLNYIIIPDLKNHPFYDWSRTDSEYSDEHLAGTLSYLINKKGSNKLLNSCNDSHSCYNNKYILSDKYLHQSDGHIYFSLKTYVYKYPMFIYKENNDSEISASHDDLNEAARKIIITNYQKYPNI